MPWQGGEGPQRAGVPQRQGADHIPHGQQAAVRGKRQAHHRATPLPVHGADFHLTHRFNENLRQDSFSDQAGNLFGLDNGANIGLEFRFGVMKHLEAVVQRTSISKTIQFSAKYDAWHQSDSHPIGISGIVSIEGDNNFRQDYAPAIGAYNRYWSDLVSERLGNFQYDPAIGMLLDQAWVR